MIYSAGRGGPAALPLGDRQVAALVLTTAQSLFTLVLIGKLGIGRAEALLLFGLFAVQLVVPTEAVRWAVTGAYFVLGAYLVARDRRTREGLRALPGLVREAVAGTTSGRSSAGVESETPGGQPQTTRRASR